MLVVGDRLDRTRDVPFFLVEAVFLFVLLNEDRVGNPIIARNSSSGLSRSVAIGSNAEFGYDWTEQRQKIFTLRGLAAIVCAPGLRLTNTLLFKDLSESKGIHATSLGMQDWHQKGG